MAAPVVWVKPYQTQEGSGDSTTLVDHPGGWKSIADVSTYETGMIGSPPAGAPAAPGEVAKLLNPDIQEGSLGLRGPLYQASDGYYVGGKKADNVNDSMIPGLLSGATTRQDQATKAIEAQRGFLGAGQIGDLMAAGFGALVIAPAMTAASAASTAGASTAATAGDIAGTQAFEAAAATVPSASSASSGLIGTALTGAAKGAAISSGVQLVTTGKIDVKKTLAGAVVGGFANVLGSEIAGLTGSDLAGQVAGSMGGAALTGALNGGSGNGGSGSSGAPPSTVGTRSTSPVVNNAGLVFSATPSRFSPVTRRTDWSTPRLNWSGTA